MTEHNIIHQDVIESNFNNITDPRFELIKVGEIIVPENYNHATQLSTIDPDDFAFFNYKLLCDKCFKKNTHELQHSKKYVVGIFQTKPIVSREECVAFLSIQNALLVSAQGESLLWQVNREIFPLDIWTYSFDAVDALPIDLKGGHNLPGLYRSSNGNHSFDLGRYEREYNVFNNFCFLCFNENEPQ